MRNAKYITLLACAVLSAASLSGASLPNVDALGDVNIDGMINILDIQSGVNQALQLVQATAEADVDGLNGVNIVDVQNIINTSLGVGGLVQRIVGQVQAEATVLAAGLHVRATSANGQVIEVDVDPVTGQFRLMLPVGTAWSFVIHNDTASASLEFTVNGEVTCLLPIPELSEGDLLNLGTLVWGSSMITVSADVLDLVEQINQSAETADADGNGVPDFLDQLLAQLTNIPGLPGGLGLEAIVEEITACLAGLNEGESGDANAAKGMTSGGSPHKDLAHPRRQDADRNGIPDFLEPLMQCLIASQPSVPQFVINLEIAFLKSLIPGWLDSLGFPALQDANNNGIPDDIENLLPPPGEHGVIDANGNGIPDYAEDNGHGTPHWKDPEFSSQDDCDGDGIPNAVDRDADGDGVPDYAHAPVNCVPSAEGETTTEGEVTPPLPEGELLLEGEVQPPQPPEEGESVREGEVQPPQPPEEGESVREGEVQPPPPPQPEGEMAVEGEVQPPHSEGEGGVEGEVSMEGEVTES